MTKLIESQTTETLPGGSSLTRLHLSPEAQQGLSTHGALVPDPPRLTATDFRASSAVSRAVLSLGTVAALILDLLGVPAVSCIILPLAAYSAHSTLAEWRDLRARRGRRPPPRSMP